jgi:hypothetical protein
LEKLIFINFIKKGEDKIKMCLKDFQGLLWGWEVKENWARIVSSGISSAEPSTF